MAAKKLAFTFFIILAGLSSCNNPTSSDNDGIHGNALFVLEASAQTVSRINLDSATVLLSFATTGDVPGDIAMDGERLYILNSTPASLSVIDAADGTEITTVNLPAGSNPYQIAVAEDALYITGWISGQLYKVNPDDFTITDSVEAGTNPQGIALNDEYIFVANSGGYPDYTASSVSVIDRAGFSVATTITTSLNPQNFAWAPDGTLHLICTGNYVDVGGRVNVIDPNSLTVTDSVLVGGAPGYIAITDAGAGYLSDFGAAPNGNLYKYDSAIGSLERSPSDPILVNWGASEIVLNADNSRLYVANFNEATVQVLDTETDAVVETYVVNDGPQSLALSEE